MIRKGRDMPKGEGQGGRTRSKAAPKVVPKVAAKGVRKRAPARRSSAQPEHPDSAHSAAPRRARSQIRVLAAEVERLERELEAARAQMAQLAVRAEIDPLTDVLNRRGFERELKRSLAYVKRHGTSAALVFIDLDEFKRVNDRHGHAAGDAVLKAVAMLLNRHVRASDLVARLGGDEFALLLWNCDEADATAKAETVEDAIARTTATHKTGTSASATLSVGASCGATMLLPLDRPGELLERADRAMYARKAQRRLVRQAAG
jgi:diguanylate cyclase (GGDEF)-like protein